MTTNNLLAHRKFYFIIALIWTLVFTLLFLQNNANIPKIDINNIDKIFHASYHFIFVSIWFLSFKIKNKNNLKKVFYFSMFYGTIIEILQHLLTSNRKADIFDLVANILGALVAVFVFVYLIKRKVVV